MLFPQFSEPASLSARQIKAEKSNYYPQCLIDTADISHLSWEGVNWISKGGAERSKLKNTVKKWSEEHSQVRRKKHTVKAGTIIRGGKSQHSKDWEYRAVQEGLGNTQVRINESSQMRKHESHVSQQIIWMINMLCGTDPLEQGNKKGRIHLIYRVNVFHNSQQASKISKMWMYN